MSAISTRPERPYFAVVERFKTRAFSQEALSKELDDAMGQLQRTILLLSDSEYRTPRGPAIVIYRGANNYAANTFVEDREYVGIMPPRSLDAVSFVVYGPTYVNYISLDDLPSMLREAERRQLTIAIVRGGFRGTRDRIVFQGREQYELRWNDMTPIDAPDEQYLAAPSLEARILFVPEERIDWTKLLPDTRLRHLTERAFRMIAQNLNAREEFIVWDDLTYPESGAEFRGVRSQIRNVAMWLETNHPELSKAQRMEILTNVARIVRHGVPATAILPLQTPSLPRAEYRNTLN